MSENKKLLKFRFSEKATKIIFQLELTLLSEAHIFSEGHKSKNKTTIFFDATSNYIIPNYSTVSI